ncbi:MAG TPA: carboxypeptidase regulatory-like domain-containing protein, partial [Solirubrobacteraceae bacterium]|nr:carboxypeptidase regulatory-like domain-containing protein [Solirubrobacteraceae bacterium]
HGRTFALVRALAVTGVLGLGAMLLPAVAGALPITGIKGRVTNAETFEAIAGAEVCAFAIGPGSQEKCEHTNFNGEYKIEGLEEEEYEVEFSASQYESDAYPVKLKTGEIKEANASLAERTGRIGGRVTSGGSPVAGIEVCATYSCRVTSSNGEYTIEGLPAGSYKVSFGPKTECKIICQPASDYITQWWNGKSTYETADSVTVEAGKTTSGINAELQVGGHISGKVTTASIYSQPVGNLVACANATKTNNEGEREYEERCALTNGNGEYTIIALASGGYEVEFTGVVCTEPKPHTSKCTHPYIGQIYQGIVSVTAPGTTSGINGSLLEVSPVKPASTGAPTLSGTAAVGKALTCSTGNWSGNPTSLAYRWLRNGEAIAGQTANTYTVQGADAGKGIACEVTASNGAGSTGSTSNTVAIPSPIAVVVSVKVKGALAVVTLSCPGLAPCSGVLKLVTRVVTKHGKRKKAQNATIGLAGFSVAAGKRVMLRVRLTGQGRKLLGKAGRGGLAVQVTGIGLKAQAAKLRPAAKRG